MSKLLLIVSIFLATAIGYIKYQYTGQANSYVEKFQKREAYSFKLGDTSKNIELSDFKDKTVVIYFGFTYCPDVCPTSISFITKVFEKINNPNLQFVFVSVDYKRDTMKSVQDYVQYYNSSFIGATGSEKQINEMTKNYNIYYRFIDQADSRMKYTVDHTSRFIVINKKQQWVDSIHSESTLQDTISRIKKHL